MGARALRSRQARAALAVSDHVEVAPEDRERRSLRLTTAPAIDGNSLDGMPPLELIRGKDGNLRLNDGVTRATRAAKLRPGELVPAEVIQNLPSLDVTREKKVKDCLP